MLIEQRGLVVVHFIEDGAHKSFPNQPTSIGDVVSFAEMIQDTLLAFVEQDGYSMFAGLLLHLEIEG